MPSALFVIRHESEKPRNIAAHFTLAESMERLKDLLVVAPFMALAVAVTYLQGYWGAFDVLPFPYLSFQELLAYSAAPIFGFLFFAGIGILAGALNATTSGYRRPAKWAEWFQDAVFVAVAVLLIYLEIPYRWIFAPLVLMGAILPSLFRSEPLQKLKETHPATPLVAVVMIFMLVGSFGYGRSRAEELQQTILPNARVTWDSGADEEIKMIGRLGGHYFYLDGAGQVNVRGEQYLKRIQYIRAKKGG